MRREARGRARAVSILVVGAMTVVSLCTALAPTAEAARRPRPRDPVLLVHGLFGSPAGWDALRAMLLAAGYTDAEVVAIAYDSNQSIPDIAAQVRQAADELLQRTGRTRLDVVGHSMGGLVNRYYVEELDGDDHVDAWVSIAGANQGTEIAQTCLTVRSCQDMDPGSAVVAQLAADLDTDGAVRFGTWWSPCDTIIVPTAAAELPGARNVETACLDHGGILADPTVLTQVTKFLRRAHRS